MVTGMSRLPRPLLTFLSDLLGLIWYHLDRRHRQVALDNVTQAYPGIFSPSQARRFVKKVFKNTAGILFEVIWAYGQRKEDLFKRFAVQGLEHFQKAREKGTGVILLTCHMGNFELLAASIPRIGVPDPYGIYRKFDFTPLEQLMLEMRQRYGAIMIPLRGASARIDALLRRGAVVGTLLDQSVDWYKGVFVDFFGRPACTNNGLARLALRTGAAVLPMYTFRKGRQFLIEFLPEVPLCRTGDRIKDVEINTQNFTTAVETMIRKHPDQYFWVHNRWKTPSWCPYPRK